MKTMKILQLTMDNFKCYSHLSLNFDGRDWSIYGKNGTGKTSIYDALTWLLFDKDSRGQAKFTIKPTDESGDVRDHTAITSVEAVLQVNEETISLRKTYYEKWSTKRGSAVETFDGHSSDYYLDGVPAKKYEFNRRVSELADENLFRILSNVNWFCGGMDWRERRAILFELGQVTDDLSIMSENPEFEPLMFAMGKLTLDAYRKKLQAERKGLVGVRNDVPVRLDECKKAVEDLSGIDFEAIRTERDELSQKRDALAADLQKLSYNTLLETRRNDRDRLQNELSALEQENRSHRMSQRVPIPNISVLEADLKRQEQRLCRLIDSRKQHLQDAAMCETEIESCRTKWREVNARTFPGAECPFCHRPLEGEQLAEAKVRFESEKKEELSNIVRDSEAKKTWCAKYRHQAEEAADEAALAESEIAALKDKLNAAQGTVQPEIEDLPGYQLKRGKLAIQIADLDKVLESLTADGAAVKSEINARIRDMNTRIDALNESYARKSLLDFNLERMEELRIQAAQAAEQLESLDQMLFLCEKFVRFKTQYIEENINNRFHLVRWKLFEEQINGGLSECCEATVSGIPYGASLNTGARVNAGIDVIQTLSEHYGVRVPLVLDNAEAVTDLQPLDSQVIRLVVSGNDKELRCELT